jgi:hypothetical protein
MRHKVMSRNRRAPISAHHFMAHEKGAAYR